MYQKVDTNLNFVDREKKVEQFWKENRIFEKSMESRKEGPTYTFYDGPPTANGKPHIRACADPCDQGYDSPLPHHEGSHGSPKSRMGYPWTAG